MKSLLGTVVVVVMMSASAIAQTPAAGVCNADGTPAKLNFAFKDINNKTAALSDFKGKVIILDFWATWCVPCKAEIPGFIGLQQKYAKRGLQVIGLSVDDSQPTAKKYADQMKMNYPVLLAEGKEEILMAYDPIPSIPVSVVIGRDGKICSRHLGIASMDVFEKEIASLF
jgi:thiol-disulfide isomerase/thioredoxin